MRQSLAQFERAFTEQIAAQEDKADDIQRQVERRSRLRERDRIHKAGRWRFWALILMLAATAVLVTIAMFQTLYWVMG